MAVPEYVTRLRKVVGHDLLWLPSVSAVVLNEAGELLLGKRADDGRWSIVSGFVEPDEQPAQALVREVYEETGVRVARAGVERTGASAHLSQRRPVPVPEHRVPLPARRRRGPGQRRRVRRHRVVSRRTGCRRWTSMPGSPSSRPSPRRALAPGSPRIRPPSPGAAARRKPEGRRGFPVQRGGSLSRSTGSQFSAALTVGPPGGAGPAARFPRRRPGTRPTAAPPTTPATGSRRPTPRPTYRRIRRRPWPGPAARMPRCSAPGEKPSPNASVAGMPA